MTVWNGVPMEDARTTQVKLQQRSAAMAARLQTLQTLATGIDSGVVPDAATIATGLAAEITRLQAWGANPVDPVPAG